jgi:hypothetical protein
MTTGMPSAGSAFMVSGQIRRRSNVLRGSLRYMAMMTTVTMLPRASISPGMMPAKNKRATDVSVTIP